MAEVIALPPVEPVAVHVWGLMKRMSSGDREMVEALMLFHGKRDAPTTVCHDTVKRAQRILARLVQQLDETQFGGSGKFSTQRSPYLGVLYIVKR